MSRARTDEHQKDWCIDMYFTNDIANPKKMCRAIYDNSTQVNEQLKLIKKHNKRPIRLLVVRYRNEVVKKWENLNTGI